MILEPPESVQKLQTALQAKANEAPGYRSKWADGPGHGPKYYLSVSFPGERPQMDYVPQENLEATRALVANFHEVREGLEEVCAINRELLRRREAL